MLILERNVVNLYISEGGVQSSWVPSDVRKPKGSFVLWRCAADAKHAPRPPCQWP